MVHIINGEIVQDNDPRVLARKQPQGDAASRRRPVAGLGSLSSSSGSGGSESAGGAPPQHAAPHGAPASPLQSLARMLGIEGAVTIPAFLSFPARQVEKIHLALAALMVFLFGWRALIFLAFAFFLSSQQPAPPQQRQ